MLRLTAKSTQFGRGTFTSWLIENAGTVPIKRRRDFAEGEEVDNSIVMGSLMNVSTFYSKILVLNRVIIPGFGTGRCRMLIS
jgi:hypothetical protein